MSGNACQCGASPCGCGRGNNSGNFNGDGFTNSPFTAAQEARIKQIVRDIVSTEGGLGQAQPQSLMCDANGRLRPEFERQAKAANYRRSVLAEETAQANQTD